MALVCLFLFNRSLARICVSATLLSLLRSVCLRYKSVTVPDRVVSTSLTVLSSGTSKSFDFATDTHQCETIQIKRLQWLHLKEVIEGRGATANLMMVLGRHHSDILSVTLPLALAHNSCLKTTIRFGKYYKALTKVDICQHTRERDTRVKCL